MEMSIPLSRSVTGRLSAIARHRSQVKQPPPCFEMIHAKVQLYLCNSQPWLLPWMDLTAVSVELRLPYKLLSAYFNQYLQTSFPVYMNQCRVAQACAVLREGQACLWNLEAVGKVCGFKSRSNFFKVFKELVGVTPLEFAADASLVAYPSPL